MLDERFAASRAAALWYNAGMLVPFFAILLAVGLYGVIHSWLASASAKLLARRHFGKLASRFYRLAYNGFAVISFLPVLALLLVLPNHPLYALPAPFSLLMLGGQGLAALALLAAVLQTDVWSFVGLRQLASPSGDETALLTVRGLYRWVRHPIYSASLVFIWLTPVMSINLLALNIGLSAYFVIGARFEERKLLREFGDAYARYQRATPMLLPRFPRGG